MLYFWCQLGTVSDHEVHETIKTHKVNVWTDREDIYALFLNISWSFFRWLLIKILAAIKNDLIQSSKIIFIFVELLTFNNDKTFFIPIHASHLRKYAIKHSQVNIKSILPSLSASHFTCVFIVHGFWEMRIFFVCNVRGVLFLVLWNKSNNTNAKSHPLTQKTDSHQQPQTSKNLAV